MHADYSEVRQLMREYGIEEVDVDKHRDGIFREVENFMFSKTITFFSNNGCVVLGSTPRGAKET